MFLVVPYRIHVMITSQMFSACVWQLHCKKFEPHPAMFLRCFQQFPGPLAPSVSEDANLRAAVNDILALGCFSRLWWFSQILWAHRAGTGDWS
jgi:hypothetical protein